MSPDPEVIDDAQDVNIDEMDDEFFFVRMDGQANVSGKLRISQLIFNQ